MRRARRRILSWIGLGLQLGGFALLMLRLSGAVAPRAIEELPGWPLLLGLLVAGFAAATVPVVLRARLRQVEKAGLLGALLLLTTVNVLLLFAVYGHRLPREAPFPDDGPMNGRPNWQQEPDAD